MKILMTWEMGADTAHLDHLKLMAIALRQREERVHITLATTQALPKDSARWADDIYVTGRVQLKHPASSAGIMQHLHQLGWTSPDLRQSIFSTWSQIFNHVKPEVVIAEASPGALLTAILHEIPVIQTGYGSFLLSDIDMVEHGDFPEFQQWLWSLTGRRLGALMNKPGLSFLPPGTDLKRPSLIMSVNPAVWPDISDLPLYDEDVLWRFCGQNQNEIGPLLAQLGYSSRQIGLVDPCQLRPGQFMMGRYETLSICQAYASGSLYLGLTPEIKNEQVALKCDIKKISYRIDNEEELSMILDSAKSRRGLQPLRSDTFIEMDVALKYLIPT